MDQKTTWIDFESEISKVIRSIEKNMQGNLDNKVTHLDNQFLSKKYINEKCELKFSDLRDILLNDLNKLIRALELYLCGYVEIMKIRKKSPDIESLKIDNVISFNYTNTFSKLYKTTGRMKKNKAKSFDYIHGKASINNTIKSNNMVLGIDEYLSGDRMNRDVEFITFKKYYQRIYKGTGSQYKDWVDKIRNSWKETEWKNKKFFMQIPFLKFRNRHYLYIFGHSLDVTDKDILRDLILNDNVYTIIFYHKTYDDYGNDDNGRTDLGIKITNLVKVIGQEELIRRTGGGAKTIEFRLQADMRDISGHMKSIERVIKEIT